MDIQRNRGSYYVKNTDIGVPFFRDFLASLRTNKPLPNASVHKANAIQGRGSDKTIDDICVLSSSKPRNACLSRTLPAKGMQKAKVSNKTTDDVSILPSSKTRSICLIKTVPPWGGAQDVLSMPWPPEKGTARRGIESLKQRYAPLGRADQTTKRFRPLYARPTELWNPELAAESDKSLFTKPPGYSSEFVWQNNSPRLSSPKSLPQSPPKTKQRAESWQKKAPRDSAPKPTPQSPPKAKQRAEAPRNPRGMFAKARRAGPKKSRVLKVDTDSSAFKRLVLDPQRPLSDSSSSSDSEPIPVIDLTEETTPPIKTGSSKGGPQGTSVYMPEPSRPGQSGQQAPSKGLATTGHRPGPSSSRARSGRQQVVKRPLFPMQQASTQTPEERFRVSQWRFRCFACGFQRLFVDRESLQSVEAAVRDHLSNYHNVGDVESYLSRYLDSVNHCAVIEAFPGFKGAGD